MRRTLSISLVAILAVTFALVATVKLTDENQGALLKIEPAS